MKKRDEQIIEAAIRLFTRYGVKRTGMHDIAAEVGISRQTLYNAFANKEAVLQATIRFLADRVIAEIQAGLKTAKGLGAQMDVVFQHVVIEHFDLLDASPNAAEIVEAFNAASAQELEAGALRNIEIISEILAPYASEIEENGLSVGQFADFIQRSAKAAKNSAKSRKHLMELLASLRVAIMKVTGAT